MEIWQANAAGRYRHEDDNHPAPLDPNFSGAGRCLTDDAGWYRFVTVKPGAYPWPNHPNAWRPNHIHFSLFGRVFTERLVTQMYFPGDPLFAFDPIFNAVRDERARERMIAASTSRSPSRTGLLASASTSSWAAVRRRRWSRSTMTEPAAALGLTPSQTVGPYLSIGLFGGVIGSRLVDDADPRAIVLSGLLLDGAGEPVPDGVVEIWQANTAGRYAHPADIRDELPLEDGFTGFGRSGTIDGGRFEFVVVKPGRVPWPEGGRRHPILRSPSLRGGCSSTP